MAQATGPAPAALVSGAAAAKDNFGTGAHGFRIREASNSPDGFAGATVHWTDLVILDLGLPDLNGVEVTRQLREGGQGPTIILSVRRQGRGLGRGRG
jgi:DNA-binding response OmpR family regulator